MKLIYRGITYDQPRPDTSTPAPFHPYTLTYRGVKYRTSKPKAAAYPQGYDLIYRGVKLHVTPAGQNPTGDRQRAIIW
uniref:DUF4278 domain-containing protein n=1 Tax=Cyanothece sp. (strain PCC 7425 / ATCC 29141) TaxID=395961 RepID=B8HTA7_CYAP4